jgi:hypothetical protein
MIKRLRPAYTPKELVKVYSQTYDHRGWDDHIQRVDFTREFIQKVMGERYYGPGIADLSCGSGAIPLGLETARDNLVLGDLVHTNWYDVSGPIEETIDQISEVGIFILSETLEHLDDPWHVLYKIRQKASCLILSTPWNEITDENPEHYWGWDEDGIEFLLGETGWWPDRMVKFTPTTEPTYYTYQVWMATRDTP